MWTFLNLNIFSVWIFWNLDIFKFWTFSKIWTFFWNLNIFLIWTVFIQNMKCYNLKIFNFLKQLKKQRRTRGGGSHYMLESLCTRKTSEAVKWAQPERTGLRVKRRRVAGPPARSAQPRSAAKKHFFSWAWLEFLTCSFTQLISTTRLG
jgi:hypothetical protein